MLNIPKAAFVAVIRVFWSVKVFDPAIVDDIVNARTPFTTLPPVAATIFNFPFEQALYCEATLLV
jgi:hypothetical protein